MRNPKLVKETIEFIEEPSVWHSSSGHYTLCSSKIKRHLLFKCPNLSPCVTVPVLLSTAVARLLAFLQSWYLFCVGNKKSVSSFQAPLPNHQKAPMVVDSAEAEQDRDCKSEPRLAEHESNSLTSSASSSATSAEFARSREETARNYWDTVQLNAASYQVTNSVAPAIDAVKVTECPSHQFVTVNVSNNPREVSVDSIDQ